LLYSLIKDITSPPDIIKYTFFFSIGIGLNVLNFASSRDVFDIYASMEQESVVLLIVSVRLKES